ncbi:MAG: DUF374 domain-containing protein, partial [Myxococcota bacterium]
RDRDDAGLGHPGGAARAVDEDRGGRALAEQPARGSSSRGGSTALRQMVRLLGEGTTAAVLVDGPRGPARVAKTGIVAIARHAGVPIQPVAFSARPAHRLSSWDRSLLPLPFARVVVVYGEALSVPADTADDGREQSLARQLEQRMVALHHAADGILLDAPPPG